MTLQQTRERLLRGTPISEYHAIHHWLKKTYGKASKCEAKNCPKKSSKFNWALKKGFGYERKRSNFVQMCRSCHAKYDVTEATRKKMSEFFKGRVQDPLVIARRADKNRGEKHWSTHLTDASVRWLRSENEKRGFSRSTAAHKLKISKRTVGDIITRKTWIHII